MNVKRKLTVLFAPINYVGPMNACIGMAEVLRDSGHRSVFAVIAEFKEKLNTCGFEVKAIVNSTDPPAEDGAARNVEQLKSLINSGSALTKAIHTFGHEVSELISEADKIEPHLKKIIADVKPDVIISDHILAVPSIMNSAIPWIFSYSSNPLSLDFMVADNRLPPSLLGLSTTDDKDWDKCREELKESKDIWRARYQEWLNINTTDCPVIPENVIIIPSPFANIYMLPKELDYTDIRPLPKTFHRFDNFMRTDSHETFQVPESLRNRSGKLIYLSLGSMGGSDVELMKRLVSILSKSKHRFIVSKGVNHDKYELADNMWGQRTVPQVKVLPLVDLVITHGGNNTVTEIIAFGKPMIVLPLFFDQYDNAQRIHEKGFGIRLAPYECSEQELLNSIDLVLNDKSIAEKLSKASQRIRNEKNLRKITELVESLV